MRTVEISRCLAVGLVMGTLSLQALAEYPETVPVGNANNRADDTGFGSVSYAYRIGKYEVTQEEYCEFLNATAKSNGQGWRPQMQRYGLGRSGGHGNFVYSVSEGGKKKPVVLVDWHDTIRFCNWLTNGKGEGSTDTGSYTFVDEWGEKTIKMPDHAALAAGSKVHWVLASENEWYKAAYYDPNKNGGSGGYWPYPSPKDNPPSANLGTGSMTDVGSSKVASAYGTYDQGGSAWEWNETQANGNCGVRGGSFWINDNAHYMHKGTRYCSNPPGFVYDNYGFRVVALGGKASSKE